jgi:hypothetical protein
MVAWVRIIHAYRLRLKLPKIQCLNPMQLDEKAGMKR